jgi:hypothetical protein
MLERLKFARYALRFERAFKTDQWDAVRACFHDTATYSLEGAGEYSGVHRGGDAIVALLKRMLDELDRKFDKRQPRLAGFPRIVDGELVMHWRVRYTVGPDAADLTGTSRCRFDGWRISTLVDVMPEHETAALAAIRDRVKRAGAH